MILNLNNTLIELTRAPSGLTFAIPDSKLIGLAGLIISIAF